MVRVNGNEISNENIHTISELLQNFSLNENDTIEVISFVGGG